MTEVIIIRGTRHVVWECQSCGVIATCPETLFNSQREVGGYHHCCNGHAWGWSKDGCELANTRRERDRYKQQLARAEMEVQEAYAAQVEAEHKAAASQRQVAKLTRRASAGVCPCCNRTFSALARHMKTKHPTWSGDNVIAISG